MVYHHTEDINFSLKYKLPIREWIKQAVNKEGFILGDVNYIYCSDEYLLTMNKEHLDHNYYTDVITFSYNEDNIVSGDIFISIDRVKDFAKSNNLIFNEELYRVMIHGILHLCGYDDKNEDDKRVMTNKENEYLSKLTFV